MVTAAAHFSLVWRALSLRRRARPAERGGGARSWGDTPKRWRRHRGGGRPAPLPPSRSESDFRQIRVGSRTRAESASLSFVDPFRELGRVLVDSRIPMWRSGWAPPSRPEEGRCRDTSGAKRGGCCGGSAGAVAGQLRGQLPGVLRGCQDSGWRWLRRPRSRCSRPATSPGKNRRFWFGGAPLASGNRVLPAVRTRSRTGPFVAASSPLLRRVDLRQRISSRA